MFMVGFKEAVLRGFKGRERGCFGFVSFSFSPRAEVLVNIAKANTSVFHHRRTNTSLSHASCFLYLPSGFTSFLLSLLADFACVEELDTFNLYPLLHCYIASPAAACPNNHESHLLCARCLAYACACYAYYLYVCVRETEG